jgi:Fic family protein
LEVKVTRLPQKPPDFRELFRDPERLARLTTSPEVREIVEKANADYAHWEDFRYRFTAPAGFTDQSVWQILRLGRAGNARTIPLAAPDGTGFSYGMPDRVLRDLEFIEHYGGAQLEVLDPSSPTSADKDRYLINSLMEEAITSSQLEGAAITLQQGKELLRAGHKPRTPSEQMVLNNYMTIRRLRQLAGQPLTVGMIQELQRNITAGTLDHSDAAGRFRRPDERVDVVDPEGNVLYTPPPADQLPERIERLCQFANDARDMPFIHPVVRAILLHFWLACEHPFVDGNGRTARALFYWYMLKSGYWLMEFVSISSALLESPAQYRDAFLYSETDGGDATYFIVYHLKVVRRALENLKHYIKRKQQEMAEMTHLLKGHQSLNYRQHALLHHAVRHTGAVYTFRSHATSHRISLATARIDLYWLVKAGFLQEKSRGREKVFLPVPNLGRQIRETLFPTPGAENP